MRQLQDEGGAFAQSEALGPTARAAEDAQNLENLPLQAIGDNERRLRDHELTRAGYTPRPPDICIFRQEFLDRIDDAQGNALRRRIVVIGNIRA